MHFQMTKIQGRCLAVRVKRPMSDLVHVCLYFPPCTAPGAAKIAKAMIKWTAKLFHSLPLRCLPVLYMDANSKFGQMRTHLGVVNIDSKSIGEHNLGVENKIGVLIRKFLESQHLFLTQTARPLQPSFYSAINASTSLIDYVAVPLSVWQCQALCASSSVWIHSGRRVQLIKSPILADHMPVACTVKRAIYVCTMRATPKVDRDAIMRCMMYGYKRNTLMSKFENIATRFSNVFE